MIGQLKPSEMEALLAAEATGRIGCHAEGKTYVVPVTYVYRDGFIFCHTGEGMKVAMMRQNPSVCFEVDHTEDLRRWKSVIIQGKFSELHGEEASKAMTYLSTRLFPDGIPKAPEAEGLFPELDRAVLDGRRGLVFKIRVTEMTGRFERHP